MAPGQTWNVEFENELRRAETARAAGNEGKARVCARRAAGLVAAEYLQRQGLSLATGSAIEHLKYLADLEELPPLVREVALHFMLHVSADHDLPVKVDLIDEARWLASQLLPE
jgi:hypothetical protein